MAYWLAVPGSVKPHGYSRCWLPPAAAYSHSASLGRKPPSQMQNAYASNQFTQLIGSRSLLPADGVHVAYAWALVGSHTASDRLLLVGAMSPLSVTTQPGS